MNTFKLQELALVRDGAEKAKQAMNRMIKDVQESIYYKNMQDDYQKWQSEIDRLTQEIKAEALGEHAVTGDKALPGVTIKVMKSYVCTDEAAATTWALENKQFLQIDWRSFDKEAKTLHGSIYQFPFYEERQDPQAQIKSDLSEFIKVKQEQN